MLGKLTDLVWGALETAMDGLPGAALGDKIEFAANILGIAGFAMSLALILFGPIYRRGWRRLATRGDLERLGGSVAEQIGERIAARLAAAALGAPGAGATMGAAPDGMSGGKRGDAPAGTTLERVRADLAAAVAMVMADPTRQGQDAVEALLDGDTRPAERLLAARAAAQVEADPGGAAEALHLTAALRSVHDGAGALDACRAALRIEPDSALGWSRLAHLYLRLGRAEEAQAAFDRALRCSTGEGRMGGEAADRAVALRFARG